MYRPPFSANNGLRISVFLEKEWPAFLDNYAITPRDIVIVGDMNFHLNIVDDHDSQRFISILDLCGLQQHVCESTHFHGHTLDVVITRDTSRIVSDVVVTDPGLCDHFAVNFTAAIIRPTPIRPFKCDITDSTIPHP